MIANNLRVLIEKLDDYCTKALESSVGLCVNRGHYEVRWEHLFMEFLDDTQGEVATILRQFKVDVATLKKALIGELENLGSGNTGRPSFSPLSLTGWSMPGASAPCATDCRR